MALSYSIGLCILQRMRYQGRGPRGHQEAPIDRTTTCPTLIRCFHRIGGHFPLTDFGTWDQRKEPADELQIYSWRDASLRELSELVAEVLPSAREANASLSFALIYADKRGEYILKKVGQVHASRSHPEDQKTLRQLKFQPGDFLSVSIQL